MNLAAIDVIFHLSLWIQLKQHSCQQKMAREDWGVCCDLKVRLDLSHWITSPHRLELWFLKHWRRLLVLCSITNEVNSMQRELDSGWLDGYPLHLGRFIWIRQDLTAVLCIVGSAQETSLCDNLKKDPSIYLMHLFVEEKTMEVVGGERYLSERP